MPELEFRPEKGLTVVQKPVAQTPPQQGGKSGGKANYKGPHPRGDFKGRFTTTRDGTEICFKFATGGHDKCKAPCAGNRAHVRQICLQPHPNGECSKRG